MRVSIGQLLCPTPIEREARSRGMIELTLAFRMDAKSAVLTSTSCKIGDHVYSCFRGKDSHITGKGSFTWSSAVRALCILLVKTSPQIRGLNNQEASISGEAGSLAASLDYALSKQPRWLTEMFGIRGNGIPNIRYLIHRSNSGRKKPGPVQLHIRSDAKIRTVVLINDLPASSQVGLLDLLNALGRTGEFDLDQRLNSEIGQNDSRVIPLTDSESSSFCPYPGLRSFEEVDAPFFHGREEERAELLREILMCPAVVLVGSSGSGKSSLIKAGVLPYLKSESPSFGKWAPYVMRPFANPIRDLYDVIVGGQRTNDSYSSQQLNYDLNHIRIVLTRDRSPDDHTLIVIDQAEELFTSCTPCVGEEFLEFLAELLEDLPSLHVLFSIRSDFLGYLIDARGGSIWGARIFSLPKMPVGLLRIAIELPARVNGVHVELSLVDAILEDVGVEAGQLPLVQFVLQNLWEKRDSGRMTLAAYREIGRLQGAFSKHCETVFGEFSSDEKNAFSSLVSALVNIEIDSGVVTKRTKRLYREFDTPLANVLSRLINARILVSHEDSENDYFIVELAHEAIIPGWHRIQEIIDRDKEFILWRNQLSGRISQYTLEKGDSNFLLRGESLLRCTQFSDYYDRLQDDELEFIEASQQLARDLAHSRQREQCEYLMQTVYNSDMSMLLLFAKQFYEMGDVGHAYLIETLDKTSDHTARYRAMLILTSLGISGDYVFTIGNQMALTLEAPHVRIVGELVSKFLPDLRAALWRIFADAKSKSEFIRLSAFLAYFDPDAVEWNDFHSQLVQRLVELQPSEISPWIEFYTPIRAHLIDQLSKILSDKQLRSERSVATLAILKLYENSEQEILHACVNAPLSDLGEVIHSISTWEDPYKSFASFLKDASLKHDDMCFMEYRAKAAYSLLLIGDIRGVEFLAGVDELEALSNLLLLGDSCGIPSLDPRTVIETKWENPFSRYAGLVITSQKVGAGTDVDQNFLLSAYATEEDAGLHAIIGSIFDRSGLKNVREKFEYSLTEHGKSVYQFGNWMLVPVNGHILEFCRVSIHHPDIWICNVPITKRFFSEFRWTQEIQEYSSYMPHDDCPVVGITWYDASEFCQWLTLKMRIKCRFRLPYSHEWFAAANGNLGTEYWFGNSETAFPLFGWYYANSNTSTQPVRSLIPSPGGLFDLHGNVWEWCADIYTQSGQNLSETSDYADDVVGDSRILRGGSWCDSPNWCRLSQTSNPHWPTDRGLMFGARLLLEFAN